MADSPAASDLIDALECSHSLLQACWDVVDTPILVLDAAGRIRQCNRACETLIEYDCAEIKGQPAVDLLVAPEERAVADATLTSLQAGPTEVRRTVTCLTKSGARRRVQWTGRSLGASDEIQAIVATGRSIAGDSPQEDRPRRAPVADIQDEVLEEIGVELHDGVVSHLAGTTMFAEALSRKIRAGTVEPADGERLVRFLREGLSQARKLAHRFVAEGVDRTHFPTALRQLAELTEQQSAVTVQCDIDADAFLPNNEAAKHLYRIAQEATINAVRHGSPSRIQIRATVDCDETRLVVLDDGVGFDPDAELGVGLRSMQERAERLGGRVVIEPRSAGGTAVRCVVPHTDASAPA